MAKLDKSLSRKARKRPLSAKAVVVTGKKVLLLKQSDGSWDLPGGKLDRGETVNAGLLREVWEETRVRVDPLAILTSGARKDSVRDRRIMVSVLCAARKPLRKKHIRLSSEHDDFIFVDIRKVKRLKLRKRHADAISAAERRLRKTSFATV